MQEGAVMEMAKWFMGLTLFLLIFAAVVFFFQLGQVNDFKLQVNYQIERNGGLTTNAISEIDAYSEKYYDGRFSVDSDLLNTKVNFGEIVDYQAHAVFDIIIFPIPDVKLSFDGTGVSQIR